MLKAIVKVGSYENGQITLDQFGRLIDIIQLSVDASMLSLDGLDDSDEDGNREIQVSKKSKVILDADEDSTDGNKNYLLYILIYIIFDVYLRIFNYLKETMIPMKQWTKKLPKLLPT
jgi:hypothetical protein